MLGTTTENPSNTSALDPAPVPALLASTAMGRPAPVLAANAPATPLDLAMQPMSQALQEYPEMAEEYAAIHNRLAPQGETVQMLARVGYGPKVAASPRWTLENKIIT